MFQRVDLADIALLAAVLPPDRHHLAEPLISRLGSLPDAIHADDFALRSAGADNLVISIMAALREAIARTCRATASRREVFRDWRAIVEFCRALIGREPVANLVVLFLDGQRRLIRDEIVMSGTVDAVRVYPREIVQLALRYHASAIVMARNDPSGNDALTRDDRAAAEEVSAALGVFDIELFDHLVISPSGCGSFRGRATDDGSGMNA